MKRRSVAALMKAVAKATPRAFRVYSEWTWAPFNNAWLLTRAGRYPAVWLDDKSDTVAVVEERGGAVIRLSMPISSAKRAKINGEYGVMNFNRRFAGEIIRGIRSW